jgi:hypothetical protein
MEAFPLVPIASHLEHAWRFAPSPVRSIQFVTLAAAKSTAYTTVLCRPGPDTSSERGPSQFKFDSDREKFT